MRARDVSFLRARQEAGPRPELSLTPAQRELGAGGELLLEGDVRGGALLPGLRARQQQFQPGERLLQRAHQRQLHDAVANLTQLRQERVVRPLREQSGDFSARRRDGRHHERHLPRAPALVQVRAQRVGGSVGGGVVFGGYRGLVVVVSVRLRVRVAPGVGPDTHQVQSGRGIVLGGGDGGPGRCRALQRRAQQRARGGGGVEGAGHGIRAARDGDFDAGVVRALEALGARRLLSREEGPAVLLRRGPRARDRPPAAGVGGGGGGDRGVGRAGGGRRRRRGRAAQTA